ATDTGPKITQGAVIGRQRLHIGVNLRAIDFAAKQVPEIAGLRLDLGFQHRIGRNRIALECDGRNSLKLTLVDHEDEVLIARLVAFEDRDAGPRKPAAAIKLFDLAARLLGSIRIQRVVLFDADLLEQLFLGEAAIAEEFDLVDSWSLEN